MDIDHIKSVYCIGIGGSGASSLARLFKARGKQVSGSDAADSVIVQALRQEGIPVHIPEAVENVPLDADLYIYSDAVPSTNPERAVLTRQHLEHKSLTYFAAVGEFIKMFIERIAVSGTHGKTTTTAMLTLVLQAAGLDPTAIVGSTIKVLHSSIRVGQDNHYCVVEACEHRAHMLQLHPTAIVLTNIEEDHLDYYRDLEHIQLTFQQYVDSLPRLGLLVKNADDPASQMIDFAGKIITYGIEQPADIAAYDIQKQDQQQTFKVGETIYQLVVPGDFNIYNALAVIAYATAIGIPTSAMQTGLAQFTGTWRRFEVIGSYRKAVVISDYAHHPTAVAALLKAAREFYPERRLVLAFQPHQHNRTRKLFKQFIHAFDQADLTIIQEIFDVVGREAVEDQTISSQDLVKAVEQTGKLVLYSSNHTNTKQLLAEHVEANDVVLIAGAGDIYTIAEELCSNNSK